jgi:hypothetical protein
MSRQVEVARLWCRRRVPEARAGAAGLKLARQVEVARRCWVPEAAGLKMALQVEVARRRQRRRRVPEAPPAGASLKLARQVELARRRQGRRRVPEAPPAGASLKLASHALLVAGVVLQQAPRKMMRPAAWAA